ncbi:MAG: hypothetical protein KAI47_14810 [Deltaproteobacteria bacterium]|nr:hypothetical protein [Deltaproteobacteria bacterium]
MLRCHEPELNRRSFGKLLAVIYVVHLAIVAYVVSPSVVFSGRPFGGADYQTHFHQTLRLTKALRERGRSYAYEPRFLAGHPMGVIFDVDNKAHFLFSYVLHSAGVRLAVAFNLFTFLIALFFPFLFLWATRLWGGGPRAQLWAFALATPYYFLDTATRFFSTAGMISYVAAALLSVLTISLFFRFIEGALDKGKGPYFWLILFLLPLCHLVHVWAFAILSGPLFYLYVRSARRLNRRTHLQVAVFVLTTLGANAYWIFAALENRKLLATSYLLGQASPWSFILDVVEILPFRPAPTMQATLVRTLAIVGVVFLLVRWWREGDRRARPAAFLIGWTFFLTYMSSYIPLVGLTEPYRFVVALAVSSLVIGAPFYAQFLTWESLRTLRQGRVLPYALLALVLLGPQVVRQVFAAAPELIPGLREKDKDLDPPPWKRGRMGLTKPIITLRYGPVREVYWELASYLKEKCAGQGRILVEPWPLGEYLGWATDLHIIGGFPDRRMIFEDAYLFRPKMKGSKLYWGKNYYDYLRRYNIRFVVMHTPFFPMVEANRPAMRFLRNIGGYRIYRATHHANYFAQGTGEIQAELDHLYLKNVRPRQGDNSVVLRFHYVDGLKCSPHCHVEHVPVKASRASFLRIVGDPALAPKITIEYRP